MDRSTRSSWVDVDASCVGRNLMPGDLRYCWRLKGVMRRQRAAWALRVGLYMVQDSRPCRQLECQYSSYGRFKRLEARWKQSSQQTEIGSAVRVTKNSHFSVPDLSPTAQTGVAVVNSERKGTRSRPTQGGIRSWRRLREKSVMAVGE